jgi:hypothetical protein
VTAQLSRLSYIALAKEATQGTYVAPTFFVPNTKADAEDVYVPLRDESYRNNDTGLQGLYQGSGDSTFDFDLHSYPDALPYLFRAIIGPDTVVAGVSTTLTSNCGVGGGLGGTPLSFTASPGNNAIIKIADAGGANTEYVQIGMVTGSGPYTANVTTPATGTQYAHTAAGGSVVSQSTHSFKQNPTVAQTSWSWTKYDVATNTFGSHSRGFPGCKLTELALKLDPKATLTASAKFIGWLSAEVADPVSPTFSSAQPMLGWQWSMTNGGASSTRGLTYDMTLKRPTEAIHSSDGVQGPRETFQGVFDVTGSYKAIFENDTDLNLYLQYSQQPTTATLTQPVTSGGSVVTLTSSKSGWNKGKVDTSGLYVTADFTVDGIYNATDGGAFSATVTNFVSSAY